MRKIMRVSLLMLPLLVVLMLLMTVSFAPSARADEGDGGGADFLPFLDSSMDLSHITPDGGGSTPGVDPGNGNAPHVGANVRINAPQQPFPNGLLGRSETSIAVSSDGKHMVAGFNDAQGFCGTPFGVACTPESPIGLSGYAFSSDGGITWTDGGAPPPFTANGHATFSRGDPWLDRGGSSDQEGEQEGDNGATYYYANLSVDATTGAELGVTVHRGHFTENGGFVWTDVHLLPTPDLGNNTYDKESLVAAHDGSGTVYVTVTNFKLACGNPQFGGGQIEVWRSHDGGNTWTGPTVAGPDLTNCSNGTRIIQQSSNGAIGPHGELDVTWSVGPTFNPDGSVTTDAKIVVATSLDGGVTFGAPVVVGTTNSMRQDVPVGYNRTRMNDHPRITVATTGRHRGRIYDVFYSANAPVTAAGSVPCPASAPANSVCQGQRLTSSQVYLTFSDDKGATWSTPTPLAGPEPATGVKRFWPVVSVGSGGAVNVVYLESQETTTTSNPNCIVRLAALSGGQTLRRAGPANSLVNTFWVQSTDGGATFGTPIQMSSATSNWCTAASNVTPNFGDYIGAASVGTRIFAVWGDGRNGIPDVFFAIGQGKGEVD